MDKEQVETLLKCAADLMFTNQPDIYCFTPESGNSEWNLVHHYANEVRKLLRELALEYDCDVDIPKAREGWRRPDIVLHKRGTHKHNFLVIEVKTDHTASEIPEAICRIQTRWFKGKYCYQFGAVVHFKADKTSGIQVFENLKRPPTANRTRE